jgi:tRNA(fMet)-specific endonuclease VapC
LLGATKSRVAEIGIYQRMQRSAELIGQWDILSWDAEALAHFEVLRKQRVRLSTLDLKIACIALAHGATLLSRNTAHFEQVPHLKLENWLD